MTYLAHVLYSNSRIKSSGFVGLAPLGYGYGKLGLHSEFLPMELLIGLYS